MKNYNISIIKGDGIGPEIVDEAIKRGDIKTVWFQLGLANNEAAKKAKEAGLNVVQNKCTKIEHKALFN